MDLVIILVVSRRPLVIISRRYYPWVAVWCEILPLSVVGECSWIFLWRTNLICGSPLRATSIWCSCLPWWIDSIRMPCYWWVSNPDIARPFHVLPHLLSGIMICSSTLGLLRYLSRIGRGIYVPVSGYSCRLILFRKVIPVVLALAQRAIWGVCTCSMPCLCHCTLWSHIIRHQTIVWLLKLWRLCFLLLLLFMSPIGVYLSRVVGPVCARTRSAISTIYFLFSEGGVVNSGSTFLGWWYVWRD